MNRKPKEDFLAMEICKLIASLMSTIGLVSICRDRENWFTTILLLVGSATGLVITLMEMKRNWKKIK